MHKHKLFDVIGYTIKQNISKKSRIVVTIIVAAVVALILPVLALVINMPKSEEKIQKVVIFDETGLEGIDYNSLNNMDKKYSDTNIEVHNDNNVSDKIKEQLASNKGESVVIAHIEYNKKFAINMTIPKDSKVKKSMASELGEVISGLITMGSYSISVKDENQLKELMTGIEITINTIGKGRDSELFTFIKMMAPVFFSLLMYFMLITYGQEITNSMVEEKNSKIIELLVAMIKPGKLIVGKVLGNVIIALGQICVWIIAFIVGLLGSNIIANKYTNKDFINISQVINIIKKSNIESAFSIRAIMICMVLLLLGFLFYCVYAAICGAFINKPEETSSVFAIYTYTIVIAFFAVYIGTFMEQQQLLEAIKYIPFCIPFIVPVNVLVGNTTIIEGAIGVVIMLVCVVGALYVLSRVYEKLVFNTLTIKQLITSKRNNKVS